MGFKDLMASATGDSTSVFDLANEKIMHFFTEFKNTSKELEALGFRTGKTSVGMGLLPEVHTSLVGTVAGIDVARITAKMEEKKDDKLLVSLLKALLIAKKVHAHIESTLTSVTLNITLGIPPSITVELT